MVPHLTTSLAGPLAKLERVILDQRPEIERWFRTQWLEQEAPFHIHFSDIAFANRNETKHLPYGEGTLRADPLREALTRFERPATVISESPDEESSQAIRVALAGGESSAVRRT